MPFSFSFSSSSSKKMSSFDISKPRLREKVAEVITLYLYNVQKLFYFNFFFLLKIEANEICSTCTFNIARTATIPANNKIHKVAITVISLTPEFDYETVPKISPYAFLKAKVINSSQFALLAGNLN
jgi:hypothetical protein